jgi:hypothetical protein
VIGKSTEQKRGNTMRTEPTDVAVADLPAMPEDVAAAWASVLIDVHEKQTRQKEVPSDNADDVPDLVGAASGA